MRNGLMLTAVLMAAASTAAAKPPTTQARRMSDAARVVTEIRSAPDHGVPDGIWDRSKCVVVMPGVKKAALVVGGEYGKGVASCRTGQGWSAPVFLTLEKGSFGAQIGAESTDIVLLVMNDQGIERLLQDKVTLGADASLAAGPVGRSGSAATDAQLHAEMLAYSRARGLFAGIDLSGGVLRPDTSASRDYYGHSISSREVLTAKERVTTPASANRLIAALNAAHPAHVTKRGA